MKKLLLMVCVVLLCACNKQNLYQYHALVFTNETSSYRVSIMEGDLQKIVKVNNGDFALSINTKSEKENKIVVERLSGNDTIWVASDIDPVAGLDVENIAVNEYYEPCNLYEMRKKGIEYDYSKAFKMYCIALLPSETKAELLITRYGESYN